MAILGISHLHGLLVGVQSEPGDNVAVQYGRLVCQGEQCVILRGDGTVERDFATNEVTAIEDGPPILVLNRGVSPEWDRRKVKDGRPHPTA
jgi:hypothetical protein